MNRSDEKMAIRDARSEEIKRAFEQAQVGVVYRRNPGMPYSSIVAYLNYGYGGQRQVIVTVEDNGDCRVFMTKLYEVPEGKKGSDIDPGEMPLLFGLPGTTPSLGEIVVRKVREASIESSETMPTRFFAPPDPPIPIDDLTTLGDLIDAYELNFFCEPYSDLLVRILGTLGKVTHKGEEWFVEHGGHVCRTETAPGSKHILGPDGEPVVYTNAVNIKLKPFLDDNLESGN